MIDVHTHILPFLDDGSDSIEKSLQLLREEESMGVTDVICTPHFREPHIKRAEEVKAIFADFKSKAEEAGINVKLHLGQELAVEGKDVKGLLRSGEMLTVSDSKWVLIEFDFVKKCEIVEMVYELRNSGYIPIVAHLERYHYATEDMAYEIKVEGGYIQINAGALVGKSARKNKKFAKRLIKGGFADFIASDIHHGRENNLLKAYQYVQKKFGLPAAEVLFKINAKKVLKGL